MFKHKIHIIILTFHRFKQFLFKGNSFHFKLNQYNVTRRKLITKATVSSTIMFAFFNVCWFEDAVCSEIKNGNTIQHCRLPQCDTEHRKIISTRETKILNNYTHTLVTSKTLMTIFSSS